VAGVVHARSARHVRGGAVASDDDIADSANAVSTDAWRLIGAIDLVPHGKAKVPQRILPVIVEFGKSLGSFNLLASRNIDRWPRVRNSGTSEDGVIFEKSSVFQNWPNVADRD